MKPPDTTVYRGGRLIGPGGEHLGVNVFVDGRALDPRPGWAIRNHSPTGFEWGYSGSGPAQLALALVLDATGDSSLSLDVYQDFKTAIVSAWGGHTWSITAAEVRAWAAYFLGQHDARTGVYRTTLIPTGEGGGS